LTNNDIILDHSLEGPTYIQGLKIEAVEFHRQIAESHKIYFEQRRTIRLLRKKAARVTGMHHFWRRFVGVDDIFSSSRLSYLANAVQRVLILPNVLKRRLKIPLVSINQNNSFSDTAPSWYGMKAGIRMLMDAVMHSILLQPMPASTENNATNVSTWTSPFHHINESTVKDNLAVPYSELVNQSLPVL
jgi:hypothetical protein